MTEEISIDADPDMQGATAALMRAAKKRGSWQPARKLNM